MARQKIDRQTVDGRVVLRARLVGKYGELGFRMLYNARYPILGEVLVSRVPGFDWALLEQLVKSQAMVVLAALDLPINQNRVYLSCNSFRKQFKGAYDK